MSATTDQSTARVRLEELDKEIGERLEERARLLRAFGGPVDDFTLTGPDGLPVNLSSLFGDRTDLIVVHNMGRRCSYCTLWADGYNGLYPHLADRTAFVVVSPDPPEVQREFATGRGWHFPMCSDQEGSFTRAMGFLVEQEGKDYWLPGYSTFSKGADGIVRLARDFFGPGDSHCGLWHMLDLLADGANGWQPSLRYPTV